MGVLASPHRVLQQHLNSLGTRLMTLYILLLLIPTIGISLYGYVFIQRNLQEDATQSALDAVTVRAYSLNNLLIHIQDDIIFLQQYLIHLEQDASARDPSAVVNGLAASRQFYKGISLLNDEGTVIAGVELLSSNALQQSALLNLTPNTLRFVPHTSDDSTTLVAAVQLPQGLLLFELETSLLLQGFDALDATTTGETWAIFIPPNLMLSQQSDVAIEALGLTEINSARGTITVDDHLTLFQAFGPNDDWLLIRSLPMSGLSPDLTNYSLITLTILVGGLVSVVGLALLAISRIISPVYQMETMVDQLRNGIARPTLPEPLPQDEFGKLLTTFDQMAAELEEKRHRERELIEQLIRAQEEERKRIAYDLHDGLIQELVGARFYLAQASAQAPQIKSSYDVLGQAIAEGRRMIQGLHPTVLEDLGLEAALTELCQGMAKTTGWQSHMDIALLETQPDRATSVCLYRITQEALNNAFKHSTAQQVWVSLMTTDTCLTLKIRDDGCGFDPALTLQAGGDGWGIRTMRERATMLGGECRITSANANGTCIEVDVPYIKLSVMEGAIADQTDGQLVSMSL